MPAANLLIVARDGAHSGHRIITLEGVLTLETVPQFVRAIRPETGSVVILDFTKVPFVDSAGLGALIQMYMHFNRGGARLALVGLAPRVQAVLEITRVQKLFPTFASVDEAQANFA